MIRMVLVTWLDSGLASSDAEWQTTEEIVGSMRLHDESSMQVSTVGYLIHEDDEHLVVAQSYDPHNEHFLNAQMIFAPCVIAIRDLQ